MWADFSPVVNFINILSPHFFVRKCSFLPKSFHQSQNLTRENLRKALSYEKLVHKMLMKLKPTPLDKRIAPKHKMKLKFYQRIYIFDRHISWKMKIRQMRIFNDCTICTTRSRQFRLTCSGFNQGLDI